MWKHACSAAKVSDDNRIPLPLTEMTGRKHAEPTLEKSPHQAGGGAMPPLGEEENVRLKDIRHWMKNNLQIISSLLSLQARAFNDPKTVKAFQKSQYRIQAMALVHEQLYASTDPSTVDAAAYTRNLTTRLLRAYEASPCVDVQLHMDEVFLDADAAISYGLILVELVTNALEHAFPDGRTGRVSIQLRATQDGPVLVVQDNGAGLPPQIDAAPATSLGLWLINELTQQLGGTLKLDRRRGTTVTVTLPRARAGGRAERCS